MRDLRAWAGVQTDRLRRGLPQDAAAHPTFVLAQAAKLAEEVGELQAEVLVHDG